MQRLLFGGYLLMVAVFGIVAAGQLPLARDAFAQVGSCGAGSGAECRTVKRCIRWQASGIGIAKFSVNLGVTCADEETLTYHRVTANDPAPYCPTCHVPSTGGSAGKPRVRCNQGWCKGARPPSGG